MRELDRLHYFISRMVALNLPPFPGIGVNTKLKQTAHPPYSGMFFLGNTLTAKKMNGRVVLTTECF